MLAELTTQPLNSSLNASLNASLNSSSAAEKPRLRKRGDDIFLTEEQRCAKFGGIDKCPDWIRNDSPCSPARPCRDQGLGFHYVHPACQPGWTSFDRAGHVYYGLGDAKDTGRGVGTYGGSNRGRWGREAWSWHGDRDWYAVGMRPSTTGAYPGWFDSGHLRWSPQPYPPFVHGCVHTYCMHVRMYIYCAGPPSHC